jgi:hypothetical protein
MDPESRERNGSFTDVHSRCRCGAQNYLALKKKIGLCFTRSSYRRLIATAILVVIAWFVCSWMSQELVAEAQANAQTSAARSRELSGSLTLPPNYLREKADYVAEAWSQPSSRERFLRIQGPGRCLNPHPGPFRAWNGQQNGCLVQVWRQFADGCTHYEWFNACANQWDPNIFWTYCVH